MSEWLLLVIGVLLTFGTGVFVAAEFSLVALDRHELERRRATGEKGLGGVIKALAHTSTHLSGAQLGITLTTLLAGYTLEPALTTLLSAPLLSLGVTSSVLHIVMAPVAVLLATLLSMVVGELVPKNFAISLPERTAKIVVPLQIGFTTVFRPAIALLNGSANKILRAFGIEVKEELSGARSAEELSALVKHSALAGVLEADTATLLERTLRFNALTAIDVMTPRLQIESVNKAEMLTELVRQSANTGYSRFPVIEDDRDDVVGVAHIKKAVAVPRQKRGEVRIAVIQEEIVRVPETMQLDALLRELRAAVYQCAIVVDEYGGTAGFVTLEDLVEELVGEIADEHDRNQSVVVGNFEKLIIPGSLRPDQLFEQTGIEIPVNAEYDTVAGYMLHGLGKIPEVGESLTLPDGAVMRIARMDRRRIELIRYEAALVESADRATGVIEIPAQEGQK
ncbi:hemolysin family protein [Canibacter sp. lx-72]|uniref:hemolysin family protein n=1 Tax=Canibacter zhuwentaonis TaxID=2837491 RepID=UPI001BDC18B4|nr:hemolysin family protein [Canibacter zhuwentaonis]